MIDSVAEPLPGPASPPEGYRLRRARFAELDALTFHDLARLRERVFVVEQECAYLELDGRDVEPETEHFWIEAIAGGPASPPEIAATLRLLRGRVGRGNPTDGPQDPAECDPEAFTASTEPECGTDPFVIGRVVTAPEHRGRGLAAELLRAAVAACDAAAGAPARIELHAQTHLVEWYARFGFAACGEGFQEDGIPHTPMRRDPAVASAS